MLREDGGVLVRSPPIAGELAAAAGGNELGQELRAHPSAGSYSYTSTIDGVPRRGSHQRLSQYPLVTLVSQSEWDLQRGWRAEFEAHAIVMACVLVVVTVLAHRAISANRILNAQATQDGLTGLANRRYFDATLEQEFRRAERTAQSMALIMIDLDHFKEYNDCYGHLAGDDCLRVVSRAIQSCLRRAGDFAARYGGEEFAVVLPGADASRANAIAENMRTTVHNLDLRHAGEARDVVTFSAGVATCVPGRTADEWQASGCRRRCRAIRREGEGTRYGRNLLICACCWARALSR